VRKDSKASGREEGTQEASQCMKELMRMYRLHEYKYSSAGGAGAM
jgi:hypothetical protein